MFINSINFFKAICIRIKVYAAIQDTERADLQSLPVSNFKKILYKNYNIFIVLVCVSFTHIVGTKYNSELSVVGHIQQSGVFSLLYRHEQSVLVFVATRSGDLAERNVTKELFGERGCRRCCLVLRLRQGNIAYTLLCTGFDSHNSAFLFLRLFIRSNIFGCTGKTFS